MLLAGLDALLEEGNEKADDQTYGKGAIGGLQDASFDAFHVQHRPSRHDGTDIYCQPLYVQNASMAHFSCLLVQACLLPLMHRDK